MASAQNTHCFHSPYRAPKVRFLGSVREVLVAHLNPLDVDHWVARTAVKLMREGLSLGHGPLSGLRSGPGGRSSARSSRENGKRPSSSLGIRPTPLHRSADSDKNPCWAAHLVKDAIDLHHGNVKLTVAHLCAASGISVRSVSSHFEKLFREKPSEYQVRIRLERALYLLRTNPGLSIDQVGLELGYEESGDFSKFFRRQAGMSPRQYRMNCLCQYLSSEIAS